MRPFEPGELSTVQGRFTPRSGRPSGHGTRRLGTLSAFSVLLDMLMQPPLKSATREERLRAIDEHGGVMGALNWGDIFFDIRPAGGGRPVQRAGGRPDRGRPRHCGGAGCPLIHSAASGRSSTRGYYQTFSRDNVTLVDLRKGAITAITPRGHPGPSGATSTIDVIVFATGFDAMTGALRRIDIRDATA